MPSFNQKVESWKRWFIKNYARQAEKEAKKTIVQPLRKQIKKTKQPSLPGQAPRKRTGKFRKLIQARRKFKGAGRPTPQGTPILKVKAWTPVSNVLFSKKSKQKQRPLDWPDPDTIKSDVDDSRFMNEAKEKLEKIMAEEICKSFGINRSLSKSEFIKIRRAFFK